MKALTIVLVAGALCLGAESAALADHHQEAQAPGEGGMPPMGPPEEMKEIEGMNGEYSVKFYYKNDPASPEWTETAATAVLSTVAGGGAQQLLYEGEMMGMPFTGIGLTSYDRETGKWQTTWVDSMGARISMYTGDLEDGMLVVSGEDKGQGMTYHSRLTTYNITEKGFDWKYEMSMDGGQSYIEGAKASYMRK